MLKGQTRERYNDRLNRVLDYVYAHLEDDVSFDRLAEVACLSPYHWSRIYSAMRGETIATTIRRLKLQRAADRLANSDLDIGRVTARAGYSSTETLRAGVQGRLRHEPRGLPRERLARRLQGCQRGQDASGFPVTVKNLPERRCAGIDHTGPYMEIDHAMGRLFAELAARQVLPAEPAMIGVFFDDPDLGPQKDLRSRACLPVASSVAIDAPLVETILRGGPYATLSYTGPYADMRDAYRWFLGVWLPASGYEPDDAPIFEAYLNDPREVPQNELRTDIHLPLRQRHDKPACSRARCRSAGALPEPVRARLREIRDLIFVVAAETEGVGPLTETLNGANPPIMTARAGAERQSGWASQDRHTESCAMLFNCKTTLVETFRTHFAEISYSRAIAHLRAHLGTLAIEPLILCLRAALTYHQRKRAGTRGAPTR